MRRKNRKPNLLECGMQLESSFHLRSPHKSSKQRSKTQYAISIFPPLRIITTPYLKYRHRSSTCNYASKTMLLKTIELSSLKINISFHPIHVSTFSIHFHLIPPPSIQFSFFSNSARIFFSNVPPGILFLRPDISLETKAKSPDTTNVFRNLLNGSRIENEIKKKREREREMKMKKKRRKKRKEEVNEPKKPNSSSSSSSSRFACPGIIDDIPRRRSTTDYRVPSLLLLLLEERENKLVNDFTRDEFTRQIVQDNAHLSTLEWTALDPHNVAVLHVDFRRCIKSSFVCVSFKACLNWILSICPIIEIRRP